MRSLLSLLVAVCATSAVALPQFNIINDYKLDGTTRCPRSAKENVDCPLLCVKNLTDCPPHLSQTQCPQGQNLCVDGTCHNDCSLVKENACSCAQPDVRASDALLPCLKRSVTVAEYDEAEKDELTLKACNSDITAFNFQVLHPENFTTAAGVKLDKGWISCPVVEPQYTYTEPMFVVFYTAIASDLFLVFCWYAYKCYAERGVLGIAGSPQDSAQHGAREKNASDVEEKTSVETLNADKQTVTSANFSAVTLANTDSAPAQEDNLVLKGYNDNIFGTFVLTALSMFVMFLHGLLFTIVLDQYGFVQSKDGEKVLLGYFGEGNTVLHNINFVAVWHVTAVWTFIIFFGASRLRNFFRIQVLPTNGFYMQIEKKKDPVVLLNDGGLMLQELRKVEKVIAKYTGGGYNVSTVPVAYTHQNRKYFEFQCTRYVFDTPSGRFDPYQFDLGSTQAEVLAQCDGLTSVEHDQRYELLGPNFISVIVPSFFMGMIQEFTSMFYLYQLMCLWVWYYFNYFIMGAVQTCVILLSAIIKVRLRLKSEQRVKKMAEFSIQLKIFRDGQWIEASSATLVPGDVFEVNEKSVVPCDAAVLSGNIICDESNLTGEVLPVRKFPVKNEDVIYSKSTTGKMNTLFDGAKVLQATPVEEGEKVTALVLATGTATDKGHLIHHILFPSPVSFIFNEHLKIVISILLVWGCIAFFLAIWLMGPSMGSGIGAWFYGLFIISQILSPLLPAALVVGQSVAATRLKAKQIYCLDLPRIIIAGKVRIFCFDKTGTLTRDGLEWEALCPIGKTEAMSDKSPEDPPPASFFEPIDTFDDIPTLMKMGLSTCHAVAEVNGELIGNPVDSEMFRATKYHIQAGNESGILDIVTPTAQPGKSAPSKYHIIKRFEFVHARMSMSVAVLDTATGRVHVFVKGSFEKVKHYATQDSIPESYDSISSSYAKEGCYVLALAHRDLGIIDPATVRDWTREEFECKVRLIGLILFRNKLKDDTKAAIAELKAGACRPVMITGDNALTGIHIAKACGMVAPLTRVILGDVSPEDRTAGVVWRDFETWESVADVKNLLAEQTKSEPVELAVTGAAFRELIRKNDMRDILCDTRIFARMGPEDKVTCVKLHMEVGITAMCGDGGNDCGALRAAHVGIALSEAEASIVSPFSTNNRSIFSCVELLRQGRAALATSFSGYRYLILYGATMAWLELIQYYFTVIAPEWMWIMYDGFVTVGLSFALTLSKPAEKLAAERPTARLLGLQTVSSCLGQIFINLLFFIVAIVILFRQEFFKCNEFDGSTIDTNKWWLLGDSFEAEIISLTALVQFINASLPFSLGYKFRQLFYKNFIFVVMYVSMMALASFLILAPPNKLSCFFRINCGSPSYLAEHGYGQDFTHPEYNSIIKHNILPGSFKVMFFLYLLLNCIVVIVYEKFIVLGEWSHRQARSKIAKPRPEIRL